MKIIKDEITEEMKKSIESFKLPRWSELPDFDLYMDQVLVFLERYMDTFGKAPKEKLITNSMINNYVKLGLIKAPTKKKYNKSHVAALIMITTLKKVLTIGEIKAAIINYNNQYGEEATYNMFCKEQEEALNETIKILELENPTFKMATRALANKVIVEKTINKK